MSRRRLHQGHLALNPGGAAAWSCHAGTKVFMNLDPNSQAMTLIVTRGGSEIHRGPASQVDLRFDGDITVTLRNDAQVEVWGYVHIEDNRNQGCVINTIVCSKLGKKDDCEELKILRGWRDDHLAQTLYGEHLISHYYDTAALLSPHLEIVNDDKYFQSLYDKYVYPMVQAVQNGSHMEVVELERKLVAEVESKIDVFSNNKVMFNSDPRERSILRNFVLGDSSTASAAKRRFNTLSVTFRNSHVFRTQWAIKDGTTNNLLFNNFLSPRDETGDRVVLTLADGGIGYGEIYYKHADQSIWTHQDFIENGDTVDLF